MKCVFFDRDGVINQSPGPGRYVMNWEDFKFIPGARESLAAVKAAGWRTVLITNQQCVGKGILAESALQAVHAAMQADLGPEAAFDQIQYCPHLKLTCDCRKPGTEMVKRAANSLGINISQSWLVGDHDTDMQCGLAAGVAKLVRFKSEKDIQVPSDYTVETHAEFLRIFRENC